jgi:hypothetical protein
MEVPIILDRAIVGPQLALEAVDALYKKHDKGLRFMESIPIARAVLLSDVYHLGFEPSRVLRQVRIHCELDNYIHISAYGLERTYYLIRTRLMSAFGSLLLVPDKRDFRL